MNIRTWLKHRKIGVVYGGRSAERSISLLSGKAVLKSLLSMGFNAVGIDAGKDLPSQLKKKNIKFAYIALHGPGGEDGAVQGLLETMDIPYSGPGVASSALAMNKIYSKMVFDSFNLPSPKWGLVSRESSVVSSQSSHLPLTTYHLRLPVVVKPASQGSAIGVSIVKKKSGLKAAIKLAFKYDTQVIVEQFVAGTEITIGVLGGVALPAVEIVPKNDFYDFESKYTPGMSTHLIPPRLPASVIARAQELAVKAFNAMGCVGVSRIDFIVDNKGKPWLLEVNTIPGMTETSLLPDEGRAVGLSFGELILKIIEHSVEGRGKASLK